MLRNHSRQHYRLSSIFTYMRMFCYLGGNTCFFYLNLAGFCWSCTGARSKIWRHVPSPGSTPSQRQIHIGVRQSRVITKSMKFLILYPKCRVGCYVVHLILPGNLASTWPYTSIFVLRCRTVGGTKWGGVRWISDHQTWSNPHYLTSYVFKTTVLAEKQAPEDNIPR